MHQRFDQKVALITGAAKGIGKAIVQRLAAEGAAVIVNYLSSEPEAIELVKEISEAGGEAIAIRGDVGKKSDVREMAAQAINKFGKIDILVVERRLASDFAPAALDDIEMVALAPLVDDDISRFVIHSLQAHEDHLDILWRYQLKDLGA